MAEVASTVSEKMFAELSLKSDALLKAAIRHENRLVKTSVAPFADFSHIDESILAWFRYLLVMCFFYDYCLDRQQEEQFPEALFIGAAMFSTYKEHVKERYGNEGLAILQRSYSEQLQYQQLEKQWRSPYEYCDTFLGWETYYKKVQLCLTEVELLTLNEEYRSTAKSYVDLYRHYWPVVLLADDITDIVVDVDNCTITPLSAAYYADIGEMPTISEAAILRDYGRRSLYKAYSAFVEKAESLGANQYLAIATKIVDSILKEKGSQE